MSRVIGVFSGKGGVGKTTLVTNLGSALTNVYDKNVVIFDNNVHTSHLGLHFGLYEDLPVTLKDVLKKKVPILQAVYIHPSTGIRLIPAPLNGEDLILTKEKCCSLVNQIKNNYDMVILDCAPGLGREVIAPMHSVDEAIIISTPDIASLTDALKSIEILKKLKKNILGIVINRYKNQKYELTPEEIYSTTNNKILSVIPEDPRVPESISKGIPVVISYPYSKSSRGFKKLAALLLNKSYIEENIWERLISIFIKSRKSLKKELPVVQPQQIMREDASDLTDIKSELIEDIKSELKKELKEKIKKRLKEKMHAK